jgi:cyclophilin family peptidyl-prolyl cis-trans isomerase
MKKLSLIFVFALMFGAVFAQKDQVKFQIETPYGIMKGVLYNETPQHRDNFIKLVKEGWYEDSPFHRIIKDFMIQGGGNKDGRPDPGYTVPAEFLPTQYVHKKGALAAARMGDNVNPTKASSGSQFYIVQGKIVTDTQLEQMEQRANQSEQQKLVRECITRPENVKLYQEVDSLQRCGDRAGLNALVQEILKDLEEEGIKTEGFHYTDEQKAVYRTIGGTPHLDGGYTVFGEITEGFDVIDKLAAVPTAGASKPVQNVSMKIKILDK